MQTTSTRLIRTLPSLVAGIGRRRLARTMATLAVGLALGASGIAGADDTVKLKSGAQIVGEVLKTTGTFAKEVLTALVNWVSNVSDVVSSQTNGAGTTVTVIPAP